MADNTTKSSTAPTRRKRRASIGTKDAAEEKQVDVNMESSVALDDIERPDLAMVLGEDLDSPGVKLYLQEVAFMADELTIVVAESSDDNAENPVSCGVNGEIKHFMRGQEYTVQRKFVDSLIKTEAKITTKQYKDNDGCEQTRVISKSVMKYPITVMNDPAGKMGRDWFKYCCNS